MSDWLEVQRLKLRCEVGFSPHEIGKLQEIAISFRLKTCTKLAGIHDDVTKCIDLKKLCKDILRDIEQKKYALIETIAHDVAYIALAHHKVSYIEITIEKPGAIRFSDCSAVTISRNLDDFPVFKAIISIGSNINASLNVPAALLMINKRCGNITKISSTYVTPAIDIKGKENATRKEFLNAACEVETRLDSSRLKYVLLQIEQSMRRIRDPNDKYAPRTIDLDISRHGNNDTESSQIFELGDLQKFNHVLVPIAEIKPNLFIKELGMTVYKLAQERTKMKSPNEFFPIVRLDLGDNLNTKMVACSIVNKEENATQSEKDSNQFESDYTTEKVALITGGASKIGKYITRKLHSDGFHVAVHFSCNAVDAESLVAELNLLRKGSAASFGMNFSTGNQREADKLIEKVCSRWGRLDVLINNAAVFMETMLDTDIEEAYRDIIQINTTFPLLLSKSAVPYLQSVSGCVVNMCDVHALRPLHNHSAYCISKAALIGLTQSLAKDLGVKNIRVNGINLGAIFWKDNKDSEDYKRDVIEKTALKRMGEVDDVTSAVLFLVRNSYVTGQVINVDGGRSLNQ